jgi:hypothetical protein
MTAIVGLHGDQLRVTLIDYCYYYSQSCFGMFGVQELSMFESRDLLSRPFPQ